MTNSRRKFVKRTFAFTLGFNAIIQSELLAFESNSSSNVFTKGSKNKIEVWGILKDRNLKPLKNAEIEIMHSNSLNKEKSFEYFGKTYSDEKGRYSFITDRPLGYVEEGQKKKNRLFFEIKITDQKSLKTKLLFDALGYSYVDCEHIKATIWDIEPVLPKTNLENQNLTKIEFNINLNI